MRLPEAPASAKTGRQRRKVARVAPTPARQVKPLPVPPSQPAPAGAASDQWWLAKPDGATFGPVAKAELDEWFGEGRIDAEDRVRQIGHKQWQPAAAIFPQLAPPAPPTVGPPAADVAETPAAGPFDFTASSSPSRSATTRASTYTRRKKSGGKEASWIVTILGAIGMLIVIYGLRYMQRGSDSDDVREAAYEVFADYGTPQEVRAAVDLYHDHCFESNYTLGGRRRPAKFDEHGYLADMERMLVADPNLSRSPARRGFSAMPRRSPW